MGGEKVDALAVATSVESDVLTDYTKVEVASGNKSYTLADYPYLQGNLLMVFEHLRKRILNLDASVREEIKKHYIAYKTTTNFVDYDGPEGTASQSQYQTTEGLTIHHNEMNLL